MLVSELLLNKSFLDDKVLELKQRLLGLTNTDIYKGKSNQYNELLKVLMKSIETLRDYKLILDSHNNSTHIQVGSSKVTLSSAVRLMSALEDKIDVLTSLINSKDYNVDILDCMNKRSSIVEEYILLVKAIKQSDWSTDI